MYNCRKRGVYICFVKNAEKRCQKILNFAQNVEQTIVKKTVKKETKKVTKELTKEQIIEGDTKVFKIVSYIGILWILGLFCGSKNDSKVRFHVGQGIILTIACVAAGIVAGIINLIIVATCVEASFFGITTGVNTLGKVLLAIVNLAYYGACIFYIVTGIVHAAKDKEEKLPLIGNLAFYK